MSKIVQEICCCILVYLKVKFCTGDGTKFYYALFQLPF
jgi:hypothetical protein